MRIVSASNSSLSSGKNQFLHPQKQKIRIPFRCPFLLCLTASLRKTLPYSFSIAFYSRNNQVRAQVHWRFAVDSKIPIASAAASNDER